MAGRWQALAGAVGVALAVSLGGCVDAEEEACVDNGTVDECLAEDGCAWGIDAAGAHCFWVGDVEAQ